MNVLFFLNFFPGIGGVESISNNLIEYLGEEMNIYLISCAKANDMEVSDKLRKMYCLPHGSRKKKIDFYNNIIAEHNITHVIDQGIYPHISKIIFNKNRDRKVKLISVLHGVPGYEFTEVKEVIRLYRKNKGQKLKWKFYRFAGIEKLALKRRADKYLSSYRKSYRRAAEMGDCIVLLTEAYRQKMIDIYGLGKYSDKLRIIPNALAAGWSAIREIPFEDKQNEIIYVGRLSAEKRVDKILEIWGRLDKAKDWRLSIVGDGPCRKELEELTAEKKLSGGVCFHGYEPKPEKFYKRAKILLLCSEFEGFGMVLIEAQRFGTVPVCFAMSEGPEYILSDGGGVLVRNNDIDAMVETLDKLMSDDVLLGELSASARLRSEEWTIEKVGMLWKNLIEEL